MRTLVALALVLLAPAAAVHTFTRITDPADPIVADHRQSCGVSFVDLEAFARAATGPGADAANSNSASWVDLDRDGALELYVVNFQGNDVFYRSGGVPGYAPTRIDTTAATPGGGFSIPGAWGT